MESYSVYLEHLLDWNLGGKLSYFGELKGTKYKKGI
jgi:hypothetical protein